MGRGENRGLHILLSAGIIISITALLMAAGCATEEPVPTGNEIIGNVSGTALALPGKITVDGIGEFDFNPAEVATVRDDLFAPGHFSAWAILVYLDERGEIDLDAHFDEEMDTWVIDGINGRGEWWYTAYYDGGFPETYAERMDHLPYKDKMTIELMQVNRTSIETRELNFREEVARQTQNGGKVVIPRVVIDGVSTRAVFGEVEVTAHDLRTDTFRPGVITAVDVVMSLGDEGALTYDLVWYDSIGTTEIVRSYFIDRINTDRTVYRCGIFYETGAEELPGTRGSFVHVPADIRVLVSPEFVRFFYGCA